jgi:hypothetical protein
MFHGLMLLAQSNLPYCDVALFGKCQKRPIAISCKVAVWGKCLRIPTGTASIIVNEVEDKIQFVNSKGNTFGTLTTTEYQAFVKTLGDAKEASTEAGNIPVYRLTE